MSIKNLLFVFIILIGFPTLVFSAPSSTIVQNLFIKDLAGNGTRCLQINNAGLVQINAAACGTGGAVTWLANGGAFLTTSTINFAAGANITITTSTDGTYTFAATAGSGITSLNGLTTSTQVFATSSAGSGFDLTSSGFTHTLRIGTADNSNTGLLTSSDWSTFNAKLSTSTGLTTANFATTSISQWTNDSGFITIAGVSSTLKVGSAATSTGITGLVFQTSTIAGTWDVRLTGGNILTFSIPPASDAYFAPSTTIPIAANPTASVGLTAVNGTASTFLRSDGAPALSVTITPVWTGLHQFSGAGASTTQLWSASTSIDFANALVLSGAGKKLAAYSGSACSGSDQVTSISATGTVICSGQGSGGNGTLASSTPYVAGQIAVASTTDGYISTISAGRSISIASNALDADAELYTGGFSMSLSQPSSTTDGRFHQHQFPQPATLTRVSCHMTSIGTTTLSIDRRSTSTPNTAGSLVINDLTCGINANTTTSFLITTSTIDHLLNFNVSSTVGVGTTSTLNVRVFRTYDD